MLLAVLDYLFMQMGMTSSWEWLPLDVAEEVMELSRWERGPSGVFRSVCKGLRDAHDQCVRHLRLNARLSANSRRLNSALMLSRFMLRFQRAKQIDMRGDPLYYPDIADVGFGADK